MIRIFKLMKKIILDRKIVINFLIGVISTIGLSIVLNPPYGGVLAVYIGFLIAIISEIINNFNDVEHYDFKIFFSTIIGVIIGAYMINIIY